MMAAMIDVEGIKLTATEPAITTSPPQVDNRGGGIEATLVVG